MEAPEDRAGYPYALPDPGAPLRVAFVGARTEIEACVPHAPAPAIAPALVDHRRGGDERELRAALAAAAPHVIVVLDAAGVPAAALADVRAATLGVVTDRDELPAGYDRLVCPRPRDDVWRVFPLPVDDRFYGPVRVLDDAPSALFVGTSTDYRERFLIQAKHEHDLLHYAHGLWGDELRAVFARCAVAVNVHCDGQPAFEHRVLVHLAAGHLLLSEPLAPAFGLEPEVDYVPIVRSDELVTLLHQLRDRPALHERVRHSGRAKAEAHRASVVWPRVLRDLVDHLAAFGSERALTAPRRSAAPAG